MCSKYRFGSFLLYFSRDWGILSLKDEMGIPGGSTSTSSPLSLVLGTVWVPKPLVPEGLKHDMLVNRHSEKFRIINAFLIV